MSNNGAVLLSSRQLTLTLDPVSSRRLNDLSKVAGVTVHRVAEDLLDQAIAMAHADVARQKFVWLLCWWMTWGSAN